MWNQKMLCRAAGILCTIASVVGTCFTIYYAGVSCWLIAAAAMTILIAATVFIPERAKEGKLANTFAVLIPAGAFFLMEGYTHNPFQMELSPILLNLIVFYLIFLVLTALCKKLEIAYPISLFILSFIGLANYYTILFRSNPILPWDLLSVKIAFTVTNNYTFEIKYPELIITQAFVLLILLSLRLPQKFNRKRVRVVCGAAGIAGILLMNTLMHIDAVTDTVLTFSNLFTQKATYRDNGFFISFMDNLRYLNIDKPEGYSEDEAADIIESGADEVESEIAESETAEQETETAVGAEDSEEQPNILIIMDEAFSDLHVLNEDFVTTEDYMPFIHSLMGSENTVSGNLFVSVCGGNTANTEFEVLTGDSMAFLPEGSVAYQQYVKGEMPNLTSVLKDQGYKAIALHPYNASGWNRNLVYEYFGFDEFYSLKNFSGCTYYRKYVSDQSLFDRMIEEYEKNQETGDGPLFEFAVTMQNHGGYTEVAENAPITVELVTDRDDNHVTCLNNYLSLVKRTDEAVENLVEYFSEQDDHTIIVFFGDHQPSDYVASTVMDDTDSDEADYEEQQKRYEVPFFIWANYDIEEEQYDALSANYLSAVLMKAAGLTMSEYQEYLLNLSETLPVINANGYVTADGTYGVFEDGSEYEELINDYNIAAYNSLFGGSDREDEVFEITSSDAAESED